MRSHFKHLSLITATLLLSLTSSLQLPKTSLSISSAIAAKSAQNSEAEMKQPQLKGGKLPIADLSSSQRKELTTEDRLNKLQEQIKTTSIIK